MSVNSLRNGRTTVGIILVVFLIIAGVMGLSLIASASSLLASRYKETVDETNFTSDLYCAKWSNAPEGYQSAIEQAAAQSGVHPALVAAIFLSEHGDNWARPGQNGRWAQGGAARGPFQIENWNGYWGNVTSFGYASGPGNVEDMHDSAVATAVSLKVGFKNAGIIKKVTDDASNISDQKYIIYSGMYHNRGKANALAWAKTNYDMNRPPENKKNPGWVWGAPYPNPGGLGYALRTWKSFQNLNEGCTSPASECLNNPNGEKSLNCTVANFAIKTTASVQGESPSSANMSIKKSAYAKTLGRWGLYSACSHFVAYVMKTSGADPSFPYGPVVGTQYPYILKSGKYDLLPLSTGLQPGDILIRGRCSGENSCTVRTAKGFGHIELYVGKNNTFPNKPFMSASINHHGPVPQSGVDTSDMGIIARLKK